MKMSTVEHGVEHNKTTEAGQFLCSDAVLKELKSMSKVESNITVANILNIIFFDAYSSTAAEVP